MAAAAVSTVSAPLWFMSPAPVKSVMVSVLTRTPESSVRRPAKAPVEEAERAFAMLRLALIVEDAVAMKPESRVRRPEKAPVEEPESAPAASMTKSGLLVESTKRSMSPVCASVVEAKMRVPSVEVAKRLKSAFVWSAAAVVEVPMNILSAVVVGARKFASAWRSSHV